MLDGDPDVVAVGGGRVRGERRAGGLAFKGVSYGADTGGARRFLPPQPPLPWSGIRDATRFGARAPQVDRSRPAGFEWLGSAVDTSEDCLVLNVYTPSLTGQRPVMVWLHGGAFAFGSADPPVLDGQALATQGDVVVVTLNHRLNVFGYLTPPPGTDPRFGDAGNAGMLDLVAGLQWVRDHISAFGGDPGSVTVFGQSGGGAKAAILMAMPQARGLFHRAILQSSSSGFRVQEPADSARFTVDLLARLGLAPSQFAQLQQVPAERLLAAMNEVVAAHGGDDGFRPAIDGRNLLRHPFYPHAPESTAQMPVMIGHTATEATYYLAANPANFQLTPQQVHGRVRRFMKLDDAGAAAVIAAYAVNHPGATPSDLLVHIASDHMYRLSTLEGAEQKADQSAPVYLYRVDWCSPMDPHLRSPHTAELPFVFGHIDGARAFTGASEAAHGLSRQMMDAWVRFARSGDPNGPGLPSWEPFSRAHRACMVFDAPVSHVAIDPQGADRQVMAGYPRFAPGSAINFRTD